LTIDRVVFLRIAEDRGVEPYETLRKSIRSCNYYGNLLITFQTADQKYNSGLFDFRKDQLSEKVQIDDKVIKSIIDELYYPKCPYEFSVLSVEILGSAYEQFLGKQITLSKGGRATLEEKAEVRKAGGVYYTPQYIVDSIVEHTVGRLTKDKTPKEVSKIKIVDPACGSGSFLIGAYQYLLNWHKDFYSESGKPSKGGKDNPLTPTGELTTAEKKRILLNNVFGVDLDVNAVEVTKLSLLLKCMEGETKESIEAQQKLFHDRVLPTLDDNIKSGNSLIDLDYYDGESDVGDGRKVNPFSWQKAFPAVFLQGGFDCVIGNPPYVDSEEMAKTNKELRKYAISHYETAKGNWDMYCVYTERAIKLLKTGGTFGFIVPSKFLSVPYGKYLKEFVSNYHIYGIEDYTEVSVFASDRKISVYPIILLVSKTDKTGNGTYSKYVQTKEGIIRSNSTTFLIKRQETDWNSKFSVNGSLIKRVEEKSSLLKNHFVVENSATVKEAYIVKELVTESKNEDSEIRMVNTGTIDRYCLLWDVEYTQYIKGKYLKPVVNFVRLREELPNRISTIQRDRIVFAGMVKNLEATLIDSHYYSAKSTMVIYPKDQQTSLKYALGFLNSKLVNFLFKETNKHNAMAGGYITTSKRQIDELIYYKVDLSNKFERKQHDEIVSNVDLLLQLNERRKTATVPNQITQIESRIEYSEDRINEAIYELYGLTKEEVGVIESQQQV